MSNNSQQGVCPFIGLVNERTVMLSETSEIHRCYAPLLPRKPDGDEQQRFCLSANHVQCKYFTSADSTSLDSEPITQSVVAQFVSGSRKTLRHGWMVMAIFSVLIIVGASIVVINAFALPGATEPERSTPTKTAQGVDPGTPVPVVTESVATNQPTPGVELILIPTSTPTADGRTPTSRAVSTVTPLNGGEIYRLSPKRSDVAWWRTNDPRRNYVGDSYLYAGNREDDSYVSAVRFDLAEVPRGAPIGEAVFQLTGLRQDQLVSDGGGRWLAQLLPESSLEDIAAADFLTAYSAPASNLSRSAE